MEKIVFFLFVSSLTLRQCFSSIVLGVNPNRLPLYDPSKDFTCLDGSKTINFSNVNDDYCDCEDSSDEPGTSACPNGRFFCENNGYLAQLLPSSRVNDGICDCCDGSDEHGNEKGCQNNCFELGREYREQKEREKQMFSQGAALRDDLSKQGKLKKEQRLNEHADLKVKADEKKELVKNLKVHKENVEKLENEAKTKHDKEWEEKINQIKAERDLERAQNAFASFDVDESGSLTIQEIQASINLDKMYTEEEAQELLGGAASVDRESFVSQLWENKFRDIFNKTKPVETPGDESHPDEGDVGTPPPPTEEPPEPPSDGNVDKNDDEKDLDSVTGMSQDEADDDDDDDDENEKDEEDEEDIKDEEGGTPSTTDKVDDEGLPKKPDYDEETKKLIEDADKARQEFEETTREKDDLLKKLAEIDRLNQIDMGKHEEFSPLHGHCFEFTDREYTYKLCPFDKASQTSKNGNSEVSLGTWGEWSGQPYKYSEMKFTNGLSCWNGPSRSTTVKVSCGIKNDLVGVSEPSKCEYEFIFHTPAACHPNFHPHDEF